MNGSCFLCCPDPLLLYDDQEAGISLAGLGPVLPGYTLVATREHVPALAQLPPHRQRAYFAYTEEVRGWLAAQYGHCLLTEHGNMALCGYYSHDESECFHPHFLLFPGAHDIVPACTDYFGTFEQVSDLSDVVKLADARQYLLVSPAAGKYLVFFPAAGLPRQFARGLVAEAHDVLERASWKDAPNYEEAQGYAAHLRELRSASGERRG